MTGRGTQTTAHSTHPMLLLLMETYSQYGAGRFPLPCPHWRPVVFEKPINQANLQYAKFKLKRHSTFPVTPGEVTSATVTPVCSI